MPGTFEPGAIVRVISIDLLSKLIIFPSYLFQNSLSIQISIVRHHKLADIGLIIKEQKTGHLQSLS